MDKRKKMLKKKKLFFILPIAAVLVAGAYWGINMKNDKNADTVSQMTVKVTRGDIRVALTGSGNVHSVKQQNLSRDVSGRVEEIYFNEGEAVTKGDLIYVLSNKDLEIGLEKARVNLDNALLDYNLVMSRIEDLKVKSPIDGVLEELEIKEGETVNKDQILAYVSDNSTVSIKVPLSSNQKEKVKPGQRARVVFPASFAEYSGTVRTVEQTGTATSDGTIFYYTEIILKNPGGFGGGEQGYVTIEADGEEITAVEPGSVQLNDSYEIKAPAQSVVKEVLKSQKDPVAKGELIAVLESDDLLLEKLSAETKLKQAEMEYHEYLDQVSELKVYAEFDGILAGQSVMLGDEIERTGDEDETEDSSLGKILSHQKEVTIPVDELDISKVKIGQPATVTVEALSNKVFQGRVSKIASIGSVQDGVSTYDVTVTLLGGDEIKEGMTADVEILVDAREDVLLLPVEAVIQRNGMEFVVLPASSDEKNEGEPRLKEVKTGLRNESYVEITDGLEEGDEVVVMVSGNQRTQSEMRQPGFAPMMGGPGIRPEPGRR
ncbi:MAG: HlyD family efflux transporter periplasmic adaptor subunit [Firmicutes bacterium]|nr:HlyD family efflux transporter periplasmic adaptor subunit [Bacillota bacterium]